MCCESFLLWGPSRKNSCFWSNFGKNCPDFCRICRRSEKCVEATIVKSIQIIQLALLKEETAKQLPQEPPPAAPEHQNALKQFIMPNHCRRSPLLRHQNIRSPSNNSQCQTTAAGAPSCGTRTSEVPQTIHNDKQMPQKLPSAAFERSKY